VFIVVILQLVNGVLKAKRKITATTTTAATTNKKQTNRLYVHKTKERSQPTFSNCE
jgi:hypothetical protein